MAGRLRVLVAGAGIGGLTCALALLRKGFEVEVLEKSPVLGEVGAGVQISPNGMRVLASLGVEPAAMEVCFIPKGREMRLWNTGDSCRRPAGDGEMVQRFGYPHITIHRADLHGILLDAVRQHAAATIRLDANCIAFEQDEAGVTVRLADGQTVRGDVLIGADGIHSTIRRQMFGVSSARFTGGLAWRGVIPIERLPEHMRDRTGQTWVGPH
ncbi:MAG: FAD-dependent monooxygenase, partial [Noviherbaspirillum sp.]